MLDGGQFVPGLSGGEGSQPLGRPGRGGRGEALSAQLLGGFHLGAQTSGTLRTDCAQGIELFGGGRVREVRGRGRRRVARDASPGRAYGPRPCSRTATAPVRPSRCCTAAAVLGRV
ncbi:hypothetical protein GCM10010381_69090 [Streptomyces xantholiticus]|nr:hypothetical protein GCM10010381_69090 [Streptomyces xantholiticus]